MLPGDAFLRSMSGQRAPFAFCWFFLFTYLCFLWKFKQKRNIYGGHWNFSHFPPSSYHREPIKALMPFPPGVCSSPVPGLFLPDSAYMSLFRNTFCWVKAGTARTQPLSYHYCLWSKEQFFLLKPSVFKQGNTVTGCSVSWLRLQRVSELPRNL